MPKVLMTYTLAMAASRDAGNRSMENAGRSRWSEEDQAVSVDTFNRLYPIEEHFAQVLAGVSDCPA